MHCIACDCMLTDRESTSKDPDTGEYQDMCDSCLGIVAADLSGEDVEEGQEEFTEYFESEDENGQDSI